MRAISVLVLALCAAPFTFAEVNFSGTWVYDARASTLPDSGEISIVHAGKILTMTRTTDHGTTSFQHVLDGSEHIAVTGDRTVKYRAVLYANVLRITGMVSSSTTDRPMDNSYILSDDGKTLTRLETIMDKDGPMVRKVVYRKK